MLAARLHEYGQPFAIDEVEDPQPGPGQVRVKILAAGACHSDLHIWHGETPGDVPMPRVLGHENAGAVDALGPGASGFELGEPVVVYGGWGCGLCRFCLGGQEQLCDTLSWGGLGPDGGYAEYMIVPSTRHLIRIGDLDPVQAASLTDAALTPYHALRGVEHLLVAGSTLLLIGAGGLGHMAIQLAKAMTPARVVVVDTAADKRALAHELGADEVIDPAELDATTGLAGRFGSDGAAAVLDLVGTDATLALAATALGRQSHLVLVGLAGGSLPFNFFSFPSEVTVTNSNWGTRNDLAEVVALAQAGRIRVHAQEFPLTEINEVFERLERGQITGRAVLRPGLS